MNKRIILLSSAILLFTAGCCNSGKTYDIEYLTTSELNIVSSEISYTKKLKPIITDFVQASTANKVFDSSGTTGHSAFLSEFDDALDKLSSMNADEQILSGESSDAVCVRTYYNCKQAIMVDRAALSAGTAPLCLAHEGMHVVGDVHDSGLETWIHANNNHPYDIDFFNQIQSHKDVPYLTDAYFGMAHDFYSNIYLEGKATCDLVKDNPESLANFTPSSCEDWNQEAREDLFAGTSRLGEAWEDVFDELGITESEVDTIIEDSGLCEDLVDYCESL